MRNSAVILKYLLIIQAIIFGPIRGSDNDHFFVRESEYIENTGKGLMSVCRAKKRHGPPGPEGLIEASPWVKSLKYLKKIPVGENFNFVFDCTNHSFYLRASKVYGKERFKQIIGHVEISWHAKISSGCGGEFWKVSDDPLIFRSNESSGHRGLFWTDKRRFSYLTLLSTLGISTYHEPYTLDEYKFEIAGIKRIVEDFIPYDEESRKVTKMKIFEKLSLEDLGLFQRNFYRKFGNSIFNLSFIYAIFPRVGSRMNYDKKLYEQDEEGNLRLRELYHGKGYLDKEFDFVSPILVEEILLKVFKDKY
jgi:hypothetical protein